MIYAFRTLTITHRVTGESFPHTNFTRSADESITLARLTFAAAVWSITESLKPDVFDATDLLPPPGLCREFNDDWSDHFCPQCPAWKQAFKQGELL